MQNNDYLGFSRKFDLLFPQVKTLVEQTEQFYQQQHFLTPEATNPKNRLTNVRRLGTIELNKADVNSVLPRLFFKKETDKTNPTFYVISTPNDEVVVYVGSNLETREDREVFSLSAFTGGVLPTSESRRAYEIYLILMLAVKHYGYCVAYEIQTGYENISIRNQYGDEICKNVFGDTIKQFVKFIDLRRNIVSKAEVPHRYTDKIWEYVSAFRTMVKNDAFEKENKPEKTKKRTIKVKQEDDRLTFFFDDEVELYSYADLKDAEDEKMEKLVPTSAKILCQTGETVYDKYTSYIAKKVNEKTVKKPARNIEEIGEFLYYFENMSASLFGHDIKIRYYNILFTGIPTDRHSKFYDGFAAGGLKYEEPHIVIKNAKDITLEHIKKTAVILENLFELDPEETDVILL